MLDTAQNTILNKTNSITNNTSKRPNSPSSEVDKLENKFEEMFAKAKQVKNPNAKATESAKQNAVQAKSTPQTTPTNKVAQAKVATSNSLMPFEFEDNNGQDSKISLQEKITKSSKESKAPEVNPLIEALSAPLATKNAPKDVKQNQNSESPLSQRNTKEQNIATNASLKTEQIQKSPTLTTMPTPQAPNQQPQTPFATQTTAPNNPTPAPAPTPNASQMDPNESIWGPNTETPDSGNDSMQELGDDELPF